MILLWEPPESTWSCINHNNWFDQPCVPWKFFCKQMTLLCFNSPLGALIMRVWANLVNLDDGWIQCLLLSQTLPVAWQVIWWIPWAAMKLQSAHPCQNVLRLLHKSERRFNPMTIIFFSSKIVSWAYFSLVNGQHFISYGWVVAS